MKKFFTIFILSSLILVSCGKTEEINIVRPAQKKIKVQEAQVGNIETNSGLIKEVSNGSISESGSQINSGITIKDGIENKIVFTINNQTGIINLPDDIWGKKENIVNNSLIISNNGWNENTDLKTAPEGTNSTIWGEFFYDKDYLNLLYIGNINIILKEINDNKFETYKMFDGSDTYRFGFEGGLGVNVSLMKSLEKNGITNLSKEDIEKIFIIGPSQPEKKIYFTRTLKNKQGETIGYGSACSFSQDPDYTISFNNYCIITFDGKILKDYISQVPEKFIKEYSIEDNIKSKPFQGGDRIKYINSDFYKETTKFGEKEFNKMYSENKEFAEYINKLESIAIKNY